MIEPLIPDPPPARCRCGHLVPTGRLYEGYGEACARRYGLLPPHIPRPHSAEQDGPDLFDAQHEDHTDAPP